MIDPSSDQADLAPGTRLDLPLWMVPSMAGRNMVQAREAEGCSCGSRAAEGTARRCDGRAATWRPAPAAAACTRRVARGPRACPSARPLPALSRPQVDLPVFYGNKMRRKLKAGAGCEDLRVRCPHYYTVAVRLHAAMQVRGVGGQRRGQGGGGGRAGEPLPRSPCSELGWQPVPPRHNTVPSSRPARAAWFPWSRRRA